MESVLDWHADVLRPVVKLVQTVSKTPGFMAREAGVVGRLCLSSASSVPEQDEPEKLRSMGWESRC